MQDSKLMVQYGRKPEAWGEITLLGNRNVITTCPQRLRTKNPQRSLPQSYIR